MSLATRCTACGTIFRVVQDQLKVSEGWVRCGRCEVVFNALEGLFDLEREAAPPRRPGGAPVPLGEAAAGAGEFVASELPPPPPRDAVLPATAEDDAIESRFLARPSADEPEEDEADAYPEFADARFPSELPLDAVVESGEAAATQAAAAAAPPSSGPGRERRPLLRRWRERQAARRAPPEDHEGTDSDVPASASDDVEPTPAGAADSTVQVELPPERLAERPGPLAIEPPPGEQPSFVRAAEDAARWRRPRVRAALALAALALGALLLEQVAVQFRDAFAVRWPAARPLLASLCELHGCRIEPPRRLAALSVEASGLTQGELPQHYRLSLTLVNRAAFAVKAPLVELSLTDASGALLARRAFAPSDFRAADGATRVSASAPLPPGVDVPWQLQLSAPSLRVSGYTVELFYP